MNNEAYHLIAFVSVLAAIVSLVVSGHVSAEYINPLYVLLGTQLGYKIGAIKNAPTS